MSWRNLYLLFREDGKLFSLRRLIFFTILIMKEKQIPGRLLTNFESNNTQWKYDELFVNQAIRSVQDLSYETDLEVLEKLNKVQQLLFTVRNIYGRSEK